MKIDQIKVKKGEPTLFLGGALSVAYTYIYVYILGFKGDSVFTVLIGTWGLALIHSILSALLLCYVIRLGELTTKRSSESLVFISLLTVALYNYCSSNKYIITPLFPGLVNDTAIRALGSLFLDILIFIIAFSWNRINEKHICVYKNDVSDYFGNFALELAVSVIYILKTLSVYVLDIRFLMIENETLDSFVNTFLCSLSIFLAYMGTQKGKSRSLHYVLLFFILFVGIIQSAYTGKRSQIIVPVFYLLAFIYLSGKLEYKKFRLALAYVPIGITLVSKLIFSFSQRYYVQSSWYVREFAYRFDLSDFAMTLCLKGSHSILSISDGFLLAIPGVSNGSGSGGYSLSMLRVGLSGTEDYNDTIFSIGAEVAGFAGVMIIPIMIIMFFEAFDNFLKNQKSYGIRFSRYLIVFAFTLAETAWGMMILYVRNAILALVLGYIIFTTFTRIKKRK